MFAELAALFSVSALTIPVTLIPVVNVSSLRLLLWYSLTGPSGSNVASFSEDPYL